MKPRQSGYFPVTGGHALYFERWGNERGLPVVFFHGGPGTGFNRGHLRRFNFRTQHVLFFDQRGAGRSLPFASLHQNTTRHLVDDTARLLDHVGWQRAVLHGGSWGATLALAFAIEYPERTRGLFLSSVFLGTPKSIDYFLGEEARERAAWAWDRLIEVVPKGIRSGKAIARWYLEKMQGRSAGAKAIAYRWCEYECSLLRLEPDLPGIRAAMKGFPYHSVAPLEAHYMANRCFLPPGYLLAHAKKLRRFPVSIVHGRYDLVCPPDEAYDLHRALPKSRLRWVVAGHAGEPALKRAVQEEWTKLARSLG